MPITTSATSEDELGHGADATLWRGQVALRLASPQIIGKTLRPVATKVVAIATQKPANTSS